MSAETAPLQREAPDHDGQPYRSPMRWPHGVAPLDEPGRPLPTDEEWAAAFGAAAHRQALIYETDSTIVRQRLTQAEFIQALAKQQMEGDRRQALIAEAVGHFANGSVHQRYALAAQARHGHISPWIVAHIRAEFRRLTDQQ
jgi:hypothetical protein